MSFLGGFSGSRKLKKLDEDTLSYATLYVESVAVDYAIKEYGEDVTEKMIWQVPINEILSPSYLFRIWSEARKPSDYFAEDDWQQEDKLWNATLKQLKKDLKNRGITRINMYALPVREE